MRNLRYLLVALISCAAFVFADDLAGPKFVTGNNNQVKIATTDTGSGLAMAYSMAANGSTTAYTGAQAVKTVAATGTPERMAAATTLCESVMIEGKNARATNNTGNVFIGYSATNDSQLLMIAPGASITITAPDGKKVDLNLLYIDVATNADGVIYHTQN